MKNDRNTSLKEIDQIATILIIDDEDPIRQSITAYLEDHNFHVIEAANGRKGLEIFRHENPDLILVDLRMPEMDGLEVLATVKQESPQIPLIVISGKGVLADAVEALHLGAWDYMFKPIQDMSFLLNTVHKALEWARLIQENRKYREHLEEEIAQRTKELELANEDLIREITERKRAEEALKTEKEFTETALNALTETLFVFEVGTGKALRWNKAFNEISGYSDEEIQSLKAPDSYYSEEDLKKVAVTTQKILRKGKGTVELSLITKDGRSIPTEYTASTINDNKGNPRYIIAIGRDITERKQAEEKIRQQHAFLENVIESLSQPFYVIDADDYTIRMANAAAGFGSLSEDSTCYALTYNRDTPCEGIEHSCPLKVVKSTGKPVTVRHIHPDKDGNVKHFEVHTYPIFDQQGNVVQIIEYFLDITERVRIEEMMIQSEKMLSIGGLAAGIAHELNNPLASMLQNTQVVLNRLTQTLPANNRVAAECGITMEAIKHFMEKRDIVKMLEMVRTSGERATQIVQDMLSFSHKSEYHVFPLCDIRRLLEKTVDLASHIYDLNGKYNFQQIKILQEYDSDLPEVPCEQTEIQQVLLNLLMNAARAMAEQKERTEAPGIILRAVQDDSMVRIEVEDNGPGMPENVRKRVFEPFFTTKEVGVGTGLGLSVSYFIITKNHDGTMSVESEPGKGTKFIICLPLVRDV